MTQVACSTNQPPPPQIIGGHLQTDQSPPQETKDTDNFCDEDAPSDGTWSDTSASPF